MAGNNGSKPFTRACLETQSPLVPRWQRSPRRSWRRPARHHRHRVSRADKLTSRRLDRARRREDARACSGGHRAYVALRPHDRSSTSFTVWRRPRPDLGRRGLTSKIIQTARRCCSTSAVDAAASKDRRDAVGAAASYHLGVPISQQGRAIGVISGARARARRGASQDRPDQRLLEDHHATGVGVAIPQRALFAETKRRARRWRGQRARFKTMSRLPRR